MLNHTSYCKKRRIYGKKCIFLQKRGETMAENMKTRGVLPLNVSYFYPCHRRRIMSNDVLKYLEYNVSILIFRDQRFGLVISVACEMNDNQRTSYKRWGFIYFFFSILKFIPKHVIFLQISPTEWRIVSCDVTDLLQKYATNNKRNNYVCVFFFYCKS